VAPGGLVITSRHGNRILFGLRNHAIH